MNLNLTITAMLLNTIIVAGKTQSLIGSWQLVRETTCQKEYAQLDTTASQNQTNDQQGMHAKRPQVIKFLDRQSGEENAKILNTRKNVNMRHFLYKTDGSRLYILDKKSRTIAETYNIDSFGADTLIVSNSTRACETKVFVRIK
jgi:hypothetical protein